MMKKDLNPLEKSKKYFNILINNYPNTDYALDAQFKIRLIEDVLAAKEMYVGNII
jgi:outer membrane protein assembly factor BamD